MSHVAPDLPEHADVGAYHDAIYPDLCYLRNGVEAYFETSICDQCRQVEILPIPAAFRRTPIEGVPIEPLELFLVELVTDAL